MGPEIQGCCFLLTAFILLSTFVRLRQASDSLEGALSGSVQPAMKLGRVHAGIEREGPPSTNGLPS
jgi:hypothetical protein